MKKFLSLLLLTAVFSLCGEVVLIPTPKKMRITGKGSLQCTTFRVQDEFNVPDDVKKYFISAFSRFASAKYSNSGKFKIILKKIAPHPNREFYTLKVSGNTVTLGSAALEGMHRAIGRLLGTLEQCGGRLPYLEIEDYPLYFRRGIHFQEGGAYRKSGEAGMKRRIDLLSRLGYNFIVWEIGGRVNLPAYPEVTRKPAWTDAGIKAMIQFARVRGIEIIPGVNSIGHMGSGPSIFPIPGIRNDGQTIRKRKELVMDLSHPEFYKRWFAYIDRVAELFGNKAYFHIGTDEFHHGVEILEKKLGKPLKVFYPEFLKATADHMAARNIKCVAWHDMMLDKKKYNIPGKNGHIDVNGKAGVLENVPGNIVISYWQYSKLAPYTPLDEMMKKRPGSELWIVTFQQRENSLFEAAYRKGIRTVMGSIWGFNDHSTGFLPTAEFSWNPGNPAKRDNRFFLRQNDRFFYSRKGAPLPGKGRVIADKLTLIGKEVKLVPAVFPEDFSTWEGKRFFMTVKGATDWYNPAGVYSNKFRGKFGLYIYDRRYGKSTRTNVWGRELSMDKNRITAISGGFRGQGYETGNMAIPEKGAVFSLRGIRRGRGAEFSLTDLLRPGAELQIYQIPEKAPEPAELSFKLPAGTKRVVVELTTTRPVEWGKVLCLVYADKSRENVMGRDLTTARAVSGNWQRYLVSAGIRPVVALEYAAPQGVKNLRIVATPNGRYSGIAVRKITVY